MEKASLPRERSKSFPRESSKASLAVDAERPRGSPSINCSLSCCRAVAREPSTCSSGGASQQGDSVLTVRFLSGEVLRLPASVGGSAGALKAELAVSHDIHPWQIEFFWPDGAAMPDDEPLAAGAELQCILSAGFLQEDFCGDVWRSTWSPGPSGVPEALCAAETREENGMQCLVLTGPRGVTNTVVHRNGLTFDLGPEIRPRIIRWREKLCHRARPGIACGYFTVTSSKGECLVHVHSEQGSWVDLHPVGRWVRIEVSLEWMPEGRGVRMTWARDGEQKPGYRTIEACDARHIYLFNRSDSAEDTSDNEVRYAEICVE